VLATLLFAERICSFFSLPLGIIGLPTERSRSAFEWPDDVAGDPSPVEVAFLSLDFFAIDIAGVHFAWIDGYVVGDTGVGSRGMGIIPAGMRYALITPTCVFLYGHISTGSI
jgi:hypothetical protein